MVRFIVLLIVSPFIFSCKTSSSKPDASIDQQKLIELAKPDSLSENELNRYHNMLDEIFDKKLIRFNFNGGVLVAKGGNILYEKYVGFTNPKTKDTPVTDSTSFHLASTSKPFTGIAILHLIQQGKVGLNDDIIRYFPNFPYQNVTVKDLLSHRSGLPNYLYFMEDKTKWPADKMVSNADVLDFMITNRPDLSYRTGTHFSYCNTNFVLLALIIEKVSGKSYPQYMKENIFEPLGMKHTFVYTPADSGRVVMSYKPSGALWSYDIFDNTYGDKNIYSTPRDMFKWDAGLYNNKFIRQTLLDSAFQPLSNESHSTHNYGLAWRILNLPNGKKVIYHNGKWHGYTPAFARLLDEKAVIIILGNQYNKNIYSAAKYAYNVFGDYMQKQLDDEEESTAIVLPPAKPVVEKKKAVSITPQKKKNVIPQKKVTAKAKGTAQASTKKSVKKSTVSVSKPTAKKQIVKKQQTQKKRK